MADVVALLAERREEIKAMGKLLNEMASTIGHEAAERVLCEAIAAEARASGKRAAAANSGEPGLEKFLRTVATRPEDGGMADITGDVSAETLTVSIGRCDICPLYRSSALPVSIAHALSCGREGPFAEGFDSRIRLVAIANDPEGSRRCKMTYRWDPAALPQQDAKKTTLTVSGN